MHLCAHPTSLMCVSHDRNSHCLNFDNNKMVIKYYSQNTNYKISIIKILLIKIIIKKILLIKCLDKVPYFPFETSFSLDTNEMTDIISKLSFSLTKNRSLSVPVGLQIICKPSLVYGRTRLNRVTFLLCLTFCYEPEYLRGEKAIPKQSTKAEINFQSKYCRIFFNNTYIYKQS